MTNTTVTIPAAAVLTVVALLLTGCGSDADAHADRVEPAAQSTTVLGGNPREHLAHRDVDSSPVRGGNPREHLAHRGAAEDGQGAR